MKDIENDYLKQLQDSKTKVSLYLKSGIRLRGCIDRFDQETVLLKSDFSDQQDQPLQLVYKQAIATIVCENDTENF